MKSNVECFDYCVLIIADKLYHPFPMCVDLYPSEIVKDTTFQSKCNDTIKSNIINYDDDDKEVIFSQTVFWLQENGFLDYNSEANDRLHNGLALFRCARLTAKGLLVLKSTPKGLKENITMGQYISQSLKSGIADKAVSLSLTLISKLSGL